MTCTVPVNWLYGNSNIVPKLHTKTKIMPNVKRKIINSNEN